MVRLHCAPPHLALQCACLHLTDFSSGSQPKITTLSVSDLLAISPQDLVTKLRFMFGVVLGLFVAMHLAALAALWFDIGDRRRMLAAAHNAQGCGFLEVPCPDGGSAWVWWLEQHMLDGDLGKVHGSLVGAAALAGLPLARLRAALPEELIPGSLAASTGRRHGLSAARMKTHSKTDWAAHVEQRSKGRWAAAERDPAPARKKANKPFAASAAGSTADGLCVAPTVSLDTPTHAGYRLAWPDQAAASSPGKAGVSASGAGVRGGGAGTNNDDEHIWERAARMASRVAARLLQDHPGIHHSPAATSPPVEGHKPRRAKKKFEHEVVQLMTG